MKPTLETRKLDPTSLEAVFLSALAEYAGLKLAIEQGDTDENTLRELAIAVTKVGIFGGAL